MSDLVAAFGLVLVLEGVIYGGMPNFAKRMAAEVIAVPEGALRVGGLAAIGLGVGIVWLVRG